MERLSVFAARIEREADRFRPLLNGIGWVSFALITADYAGFIHLPEIVSVPLWLGFFLACLRWALWEGLIKPQLGAPANLPENSKKVAAQPQETEEPRQT